MQDGFVIARSSKGIQAQIIAAGVLVLVACVFVTLFFGLITGMDTRVERFFTLTIWLLLPIMWLIGSFAAYYKWKNTQIIFGPDNIMVRKSSGFGSDTQLYRYDSILSVRVHRDLLGSRLGYGTITLEIPKLGNPVVLDYIDKPDNQAIQIKREVSMRANTQSLIT